MDFELKLHHQLYSNNKKHTRSNSNIHKQHEVSFTSYGESLRQLSQKFSLTDNKKYSKMFDFLFTEQKQQKTNHNKPFVSNKRSKLQQRNNNKGRLKTRGNKVQEQIINQSKYLVNKKSQKIYPLEISNLQQQIINQEQDQFQVKQFTNQERQSLKNAFRYICRLVFKQAHKYSQKMSQLFANKYNNLPNVNNTNLKQEKLHINKKSRRQKSLLSIPPVTLSQLSQLNLIEQAELISGQRYFKQYLQKLSINQRKILLNYMIWFLRTKYLRYINKCSNQNKGKRKQMKKDLYIRFKNHTMLPYLQTILEQIQVKNQEI